VLVAGCIKCEPAGKPGYVPPAVAIATGVLPRAWLVRAIAWEEGFVEEHAPQRIKAWLTWLQRRMNVVSGVGMHSSCMGAWADSLQALLWRGWCEDWAAHYS
jgi:hypothetical protein